jgi:hypothetical protein
MVKAARQSGGFCSRADNKCARAVRRGRIWTDALAEAQVSLWFRLASDVLPNGNFLMNDEDGADDPGKTVYREYYGFEATLPSGKQRGDPVDGGLTIDLSRFGLSYGTGVALAPDGTLYFMTGVNAEQTIAHVKITPDNPGGELLSTTPTIGYTAIEDIDVVPKN